MKSNGDNDFGDSNYGENPADGSIHGEHRSFHVTGNSKKRKVRERFSHPMSMKNYEEIRNSLLNKEKLKK